MEKQHPLIIVFYLDAETMKIQEIIKPFAEMVNEMLIQKESNALAFFLPTKGEERVECINPVIVKEADMERINVIIEDIKKNFSIGVDMNVPDISILPDTKECTCDGGECNCDK